MAAYSGPNIVEDGLILCLDAANAKSYPGSGTAWNDISGLSSSGTLINGAVFNADNSGSIRFDGVNDYYTMNDNAYSVAGLTDYTASFWIKLDAASSSIDKRFFWHGNYGVLIYKSTADGLIFYLRTSVGAVQITTPYSSFFDLWTHISVTYNGTAMKLYVNGELKTTGSNTGGIIDAAPTAFLLGGATNSFYTPCNISSAMAYNRTITDSEVRQNFNALRGRYDI